MVQSGDPIQLTGSFLLPSRQDTPESTLSSYQEQEQMEMMEASNDYNQLYAICSSSTTLNTSQAQTQSFIDTTETFTAFPIDYNNQMDIQSYESSPLSQTLSEPLTELEEESEQGMFASESITSPKQIPHSTPSSSHSSSHIVTNPTGHHGRIPYRHSSSNLQDYGTSPTRKVRSLPRNVSDNQLSMIDHSHLNYNLNFEPSQERKIPAKDQFPNLVAYLQCNTANTDTAASQAKRPRIPRNMSDSRLYHTSNRVAVSFHHQQNIATSPPQPTPLEQRQHTTSNTSSQYVNKIRGRKGKLPRNMSDSSLMYMNQQQLQMPVSIQRRKSLEHKQALSPPSNLPSSHPVFSSTLAAAHDVNRAMKQEVACSAIPPNGVVPTETFDQVN